MFKRKCNDAMSEEEAEGNSSFDSPDFRLSHLPNEILVRVFSFLNPVDQLSIEQLGWTRYIDLVCDGEVVKETDFSQVNTVRRDTFASYFSVRRVPHIRKLILNDLFLVDKQTLISSIRMCKGITCLSVANCGLSVSNLFSVLEAAKDLRVVKAGRESFNSGPQESWNFSITPRDDFDWKAAKYNAFICCSDDEEDSVEDGEGTFFRALHTAEIDLNSQGISFKDTLSGGSAVLSLWGNQNRFLALSKAIMSLSLDYCNITEVCLQNLHLENYLFSALHCLKGLKSIGVPTCAFLQKGDNSKIPFRAMVDNCPFIKDFSLSECMDCDAMLNDYDLDGISLLTDLESLTLGAFWSSHMGLQCLKRVADRCQNFRSLRLEVDSWKQCHFTPSVCYLLRNAKNLAFLKIRHRSFNPMFEGFWTSVSCAQNLQGLCISTCSRSFVENKFVLQAIQRLPYFNLLHLYIGRHSENLGTRIIQSLKANGVKRCNAHVSTYNPQNSIDPEKCFSNHFTCF